jgi:hypothetical protein
MGSWTARQEREQSGVVASDQGGWDGAVAWWNACQLNQDLKKCDGCCIMRAGIVVNSVTRLIYKYLPGSVAEW